MLVPQSIYVGIAGGRKGCRGRAFKRRLSREAGKREKRTKKALTNQSERDTLTELLGRAAPPPAPAKKKFRKNRKKALTKDAGCGKLIKLLARARDCTL